MTLDQAQGVCECANEAGSASVELADRYNERFPEFYWYLDANEDSLHVVELPAPVLTLEQAGVVAAAIASATDLDAYSDRPTLLQKLTVFTGLLWSVDEAGVVQVTGRETVKA